MATWLLTVSMYRAVPIAPVESDGVQPGSVTPAAEFVATGSARALANAVPPAPRTPP
jgi:hypothetical protein